MSKFDDTNAEAIKDDFSISSDGFDLPNEGPHLGVYKICMRETSPYLDKAGEPKQQLIHIFDVDSLEVRFYSGLKPTKNSNLRKLIGFLNGIAETQVDVSQNPFKPSDFYGEKFELQIVHHESESGNVCAKIAWFKPVQTGSE